MQVTAPDRGHQKYTLTRVTRPNNQIKDGEIYANSIYDDSNSLMTFYTFARCYVKSSNLPITRMTLQTNVIDTNMSTPD